LRKKEEGERIEQEKIEKQNILKARFEEKAR
jgi:hypothetical protein